MKKIGIITAMQEEFSVIEELMSNVEIINKYNLKIYSGIINNKEVVLVQCGVGKVNSARTTQILIDTFEIEYIINVGVAGSLNEKLEIGDILIGKNLVQHDFDITAGGHPKGYISKELGREFFSNSKLINRCEEIIKNDLKDINIRIGTIATGDVFCQEIKLKNEIINEFHADCVEMEGASIAAVCEYKKLKYFTFYYAGDNLDAVEWEERSLGQLTSFEKKARVPYLAFELARKIELCSE